MKVKTMADGINNRHRSQAPQAPQDVGGLSPDGALGTDPVMAGVESRLGNKNSPSSIDSFSTDFTRPMRRIVTDLIAQARSMARIHLREEDTAAKAPKSPAAEELVTYMPGFDSDDLDAMLDESPFANGEDDKKPSFDILGQLRQLFGQEWREGALSPERLFSSGQTDRTSAEQTSPRVWPWPESRPEIDAPDALDARQRLAAVWHDLATRMPSAAALMPHVAPGAPSYLQPSHDTFGRLHVYGGRLAEAESWGGSLDPARDILRLHEDAVRLASDWRTPAASPDAPGEPGKPEPEWGPDPDRHRDVPRVPDWSGRAVWPDWSNAEPTGRDGHSDGHRDNHRDDHRRDGEWW